MRAAVVRTISARLSAAASPRDRPAVSATARDICSQCHTAYSRTVAASRRARIPRHRACTIAAAAGRSARRAAASGERKARSQRVAQTRNVSLDRFCLRLSSR
eukprot:scaffold1375_cov96-Isochrysis_galbana.AAC.7